MNGEDIFIGLFILFGNKCFCCIGAKSTRINTHHVNRGLTLDNPFSKLPSCTARSSDAKTMPFIQPEIGKLPGGADQRAAIRGISYRPIDDVLDPGMFK